MTPGVADRVPGRNFHSERDLAASVRKELGKEVVSFGLIKGYDAPRVYGSECPVNFATDGASYSDEGGFESTVEMPGDCRVKARMWVRRQIS